MEVWTFINKKTNQIIRYNIRPGDIEFGNEFYFTESDLFPLWFVNSEEDIKKCLECYDHPQFNQFWYLPSKNKINIDDYEIIKFNN
jgi:hypothetical protein